eukprot:2409192-Amphidinium_carterae.1
MSGVALRAIQNCHCFRMVPQLVQLQETNRQVIRLPFELLPRVLHLNGPSAGPLRAWLLVNLRGVDSL